MTAAEWGKKGVLWSADHIAEMFADLAAAEDRCAKLEEALADCVSLLEGIESEVRGGYSPDGALAKARAHLARYKEDSDE